MNKRFNTTCQVFYRTVSHLPPGKMNPFKIVLQGLQSFYRAFIASVHPV